MRDQRRHKNPSSHHMIGKANPVPHTHDHGHHGKKAATRGTRVGNRPIKPAASSVKHPALSRKTKRGLHNRLI